MNNVAAYVKAFAAFVVLLLIQALSQLVVMLFIGGNSSMFSIYYLVLFSLTGIIVFAIWYYKMSSRGCTDVVYVKDIRKLSIKMDTITLLVIFGISIQLFMCVLLGIVLSFFPETEADYQSGISSIVGANALMAVYTCFLGPVAEEFTFRGVIFEILEGEASFLYANVIQAVLFGLYHGNIVQGLYAFVFGLIFGYIKKYTGSLYFVIMLHVVINIAGFIISLMNIDEMSLVWEIMIMLVFGIASAVSFIKIKIKDKG